MTLRAALLLLVLLWAGPPANAAGLPGAGTAVAAESAILSLAPEPLRGALQAMNRVQVEAGRMINAPLRRFRDQGTVEAGLWLCLVGFVYGVIHAVGPGHSKLLVSSYVLGTRTRLRASLLLSAGAGLAQAASAILLVGVPVGLLEMRRTEILADTRWLELMSYALMTAIGAMMLWRAWNGGAGCGHSHHDHDHPHLRDHADGQHGHDSCGHARHEASSGRNRLVNALMATAMMARPCSGSIIILLFALANDMPAMGVLAVLCVSAGVSCTTSAVGLASLSLRRVLTASTVAGSAAAIAERCLPWIGALTITGAGAMLFLATLSQP